MQGWREVREAKYWINYKHLLKTTTYSSALNDITMLQNYSHYNSYNNRNSLTIKVDNYLQPGYLVSTASLVEQIMWN